MTSISFLQKIIPRKYFFAKNKAKQIPVAINEIQVSSNRVEPLQTEFRTTKELFSYARERCVNALKSDTPYEHAVIVDTKQNKVIAEYAGDPAHCKLDDLAKLNLDKDNTIIFHPHPNGFPISGPDVNVLLNSDVTQVIAFDKNGKFSLVAKTINTPKQIDKKACRDYIIASNEESADTHNLTPDLQALCTDDLLRRHMPLMGLRYVSNYDYLR